MSEQKLPLRNHIKNYLSIFPILIVLFAVTAIGLAPILLYGAVVGTPIEPFPHWLLLVQLLWIAGFIPVSLGVADWAGERVR